MSQIDTLAHQVMAHAREFTTDKNGLPESITRIEEEHKKMLDDAIDAEYERVDNLRVNLLAGIDEMFDTASLEDFGKPSFNNTVCNLAMMDAFKSSVWYSKLTEICKRSNTYIVACNRWRFDKKNNHANPVWTIVVPAASAVDDTKMHETVRLMNILWDASQSHGDNSTFNGVFVAEAEIGGNLRQTFTVEGATGEWSLVKVVIVGEGDVLVTAREASGGASATSPLAILEWISENR